MVESSNELTVYNQGFALVKDVRSIDIAEGTQQVAIEDVAAQIEPSSVGIRSLTDALAFEVLEQNYQYDLISPLAVLNKAVGGRVRFMRVLPDGKKEVLEGVLLSSPVATVGTTDWGSQDTYNGVVIQTDDGRIVLNPDGEIEVSTLPEGLISKPTLLWLLHATKAGTNDIEISYLTQGIKWDADYVLTLGPGGATADLKGWVTIANNSGGTYRDTKLKLLAGDVQRARPPEPRVMMLAGASYDMAGERGFVEETLFEYHLYTLQRPATIRNNEIKQLSLLEGKDITASKKLIVDSLRDFGFYYPSEGEIGVGVMKPQVRVEFKNSKENGLGIPLPAGNVKVYQRDASGSTQMLGEDKIQHTPRDEQLSLVVGRSFDIVAERKRTTYQRQGNKAYRETFEVEVRNRKDVSETVHVLERHYGQWGVIQKNMEFEKLDANTIQFVLTLQPGESKKIVYTVETRW
jgi:hypothetical protein